MVSMKTKEQMRIFDGVFHALATNGMADDVGSAEYQRIKALYMASDEVQVVGCFITAHSSATALSDGVRKILGAVHVVQADSAELPEVHPYGHVFSPIKDTAGDALGGEAEVRKGKKEKK